MASDVQHNYYKWKHEQEDSQGPSISQMMDHGSISFGRFAFESLSWEKRSVFTHNERQEELERFKSPGLVAKKKAYFEEYYKSIRALKAMQNQQTELSLEYGADGSISSQTGDEDEPSLTSTHPNEITESNRDATLEGHTFEIFEQECSKALEHEYDAPESVENATSKDPIEPNNSHFKIKKEEHYNNSVQVRISDPEYLVHGLSTGSSEKIRLNENSHVVQWKDNNDAKLNMESDLAPSLICSTDTTVSVAVEADFVPVDNPALKKNMLFVHKLKEAPTTVPISKVRATSARYLSNSVKKSLTERRKSSQGSKPLQNISHKADIDLPLNKMISNNARSCNKPSLAASHRSTTEVKKNKDAIRRLGPSSRERKEAIPTKTSELLLKSQPKVSNGSTSWKVNPNGKLRVPVESSETATQNTIKNRALQSEGVGHEEFKKNLDKCSTVEGRGKPKTRCINLRTRTIHDPNRVISRQPANLSGGDKSKMMTAVEKHERRYGVGKSFIRGFAPNGKISRKENPRWR